MNYYGDRYLKARDFISHCENLNINTSDRELESYEQDGIMLPMARIIYPEAYAVQNILGDLEDFANAQDYKDIDLLFDKNRILDSHWAGLTDAELIDSFDRVEEPNPYLSHPKVGDYKPWNSYQITYLRPTGEQITVSTVDHYYSYWQVYQLQKIQNYPDLYQNKFLLSQIPQSFRDTIRRPWAPNANVLREFDGKLPLFDALSFWITVFYREKSRTFATIQTKYQIKRLNTSEFKAYRKRQLLDARMVQARFGLTKDQLFKQLTESFLEK